MGYDPMPIAVEQVVPPIPGNGTTRVFADVDTGRLSARDDKGCDAMQDFRRTRGEALRHFRSALGGRELTPVNIYMIGDSVMLGAGATTYQRAWFDIYRDAMQREYRPGGEGLIPSYSPPTNTFPNRFTLAGTPTTTDFGSGWGRRAVFLDTTDDICTVTGVCDRVYVVYSATATSGTFKVVIDGGAPATQSAASAITMTGRIWDSGALTLGSHTIAISPNAASNLMFIEGVILMATDTQLGVRFMSGGHGGHRAEHYNGDTTEDGTAVGCRRNWAMMPFQPKALVLSGAASLSSNGATPSTLTFTGASPALTNSDIGEVIFAGTDTAFPRGVRVVSVSSATVCVVNKTVPAGTYTAALTRSRVTDATTTIGSVNVSSPTMAFTAADLGKTISPSSQFVAGTIIKRIVSATAIEVYPVAIASASGTGTIQILNRQAMSLRPDLLVIEFGGNDMFAGIPKAEYKANMKAISTVVEEVGQLDIPTMTGIYNDERPSVATMAMWTTGYRADANLTIAATSGQPTITRATTGLIRETRFGAADVGKTFSGAPVNGLTINSVSADGLSATLSGNASASTTNTTVILLQRQYRDDMFHDYRSAQYELSVENNWAFVDLYNIGGNGGLYDYQQLISSDGLHPNDRGQQWIADEMSTMFGGVKKLASIPQGIFNNKGEIIVASAADTAAIVSPVGANNTVLMADSSTATGVKWAAETLPATIVDAKGDVVTATANDTPARLAVGTDGFFLMADSTQATGLKWAANEVVGRNTISQSIGGTVLANVTGLTFPVLTPNAVYAFEAYVPMAVAATGSFGGKVALTVPAGSTFAASASSSPTGATTARNAFLNASGTAALSMISTTAYTGLVQIFGMLTAGTATSHTGTVQVQAASASGSASTISNTATIQQGAWIQAYRVA